MQSNSKTSVLFGCFILWLFLLVFVLGSTLSDVQSMLWFCFALNFWQILGIIKEAKDWTWIGPLQENMQRSRETYFHVLQQQPQSNILSYIHQINKSAWKTFMIKFGEANVPVTSCNWIFVNLSWMSLEQETGKTPAWTIFNNFN